MADAEHHAAEGLALQAARVDHRADVGDRREVEDVVHAGLDVDFDFGEASGKAPPSTGPSSSSTSSGPFYGFNRPGAEIFEGVIRNWWRQGMMGGAKAHYEGIKAFSETDFTDDLKIIDVPRNPRDARRR